MRKTRWKFSSVATLTALPVGERRRAERDGRAVETVQADCTSRCCVSHFVTNEGSIR